MKEINLSKIMMVFCGLIFSDVFAAKIGQDIDTESQERIISYSAKSDYGRYGVMIKLRDAGKPDVMLFNSVDTIKKFCGNGHHRFFLNDIPVRGIGENRFKEVTKEKLVVDYLSGWKKVQYTYSVYTDIVHISAQDWVNIINTQPRISFERCGKLEKRSKLFFKKAKFEEFLNTYRKLLPSK